MVNNLKYNLRNLITLRYFCPSISGNLFFIFGCQRSGTTLLLSILSAHPQIIGIDETEYPSPYPFPSAQSLAINKLLNRHLCFKMLEHSNKLNFLKSFYPNSKILWVIRHPFGSISSMLNLVNAQGNWLDRCVIKELDRLKPFWGKSFIDYNSGELSTVELGAIYWLYKNRYLQWLREYGFDILEVKFEDLIQSQETNLKKIVDFLDIEWSDDLLNYYQKNSGKTLAGGTRTDQPIKKKVIDNYLSTLTRDDQEKIANICMPLMETYGYSKG
ncbi:sulfotransferase family protein [Crocosphaera sp. Alani8]|uniref:sulfotransferase family protein n=1 Tax=Crocosphaera sp. Alani8 TaxID=3038952 RepID=UPI00313ACA83